MKEGYIMSTQEKRSSYELDMLHGRIFPQMLRFAVPLAVSGLLQLMFNAADTIVVGRFVGSDALAAVGATASLTGLLVNFFLAFSVGVNVEVSSSYAAEKYDDVSNLVNTSVFFAFLLGIIIMITGCLISKPLLSVMDTPSEVLPMSAVYLKIYFFSMPSIMVYNFGSAILRSIGDTKRPFIFLLAAGILNTLLNLLFVIVFRLGVVGVALATALCNFLSAFLVVIVLLKEKSCLKLVFGKMKLRFFYLRRILRIGLPAGVQRLFFSISNFMIQTSVNSFGTETMAANTAATNLEGFYYISMTAFTGSVITFIAQNKSAGKYERLDQVIRTALSVCLVIGIILLPVCVLFGEDLLSIYVDDPVVTAIGRQRMLLIGCTSFLDAFVDAMSGALRGLGNGMLPTIVSLLGIVGFRLLWIFTIFRFFHSYPILIASYPISWVLTFTAMTFLYWRERKKLSGESLT